MALLSLGGNREGREERDARRARERIALARAHMAGSSLPAAQQAPVQDSGQLSRGPANSFFDEPFPVDEPQGVVYGDPTDNGEVLYDEAPEPEAIAEDPPPVTDYSAYAGGGLHEEEPVPSEPAAPAWPALSADHPVFPAQELAGNGGFVLTPPLVTIVESSSLPPGYGLRRTTYRGHEVLTRLPPREEPKLSPITTPVITAPDDILTRTRNETAAAPAVSLKPPPEIYQYRSPAEILRMEQEAAAEHARQQEARADRAEAILLSLIKDNRLKDSAPATIVNALVTLKTTSPERFGIVLDALADMDLCAVLPEGAISDVAQLVADRPTLQPLNGSTEAEEVEEPAVEPVHMQMEEAPAANGETVAEVIADYPDDTEAETRRARAVMHGVTNKSRHPATEIPTHRVTAEDVLWEETVVKWAPLGYKPGNSTTSHEASIFDQPPSLPFENLVRGVAGKLGAALRPASKPVRPNHFTGSGVRGPRYAPGE